MTYTLSSLPWNTSPITDEATWRAYMRQIHDTGVFRESSGDPDILNEYLVYADSTGMQVKIKSGTAWMRGVYAPNPAEVIEAIQAAHATLDRIDRVVLKLDMVNHTVTIEVVTGTPAASPVAPTLTNTTSVYYVKLARVYVTHAVTTIAADKVTDERDFSPSSLRLPGIELFQSDMSVTVTTGKDGIVVPLEMKGWNLIGMIAGVYDKGVTGETTIKLYRRRAGANLDVFSTGVTIGDEWYAADGVVNTANDDLETGDLLLPYVSGIHTTAPKGLYVTLYARKP